MLKIAARSRFPAKLNPAFFRSIVCSFSTSVSTSSDPQKPTVRVKREKPPPISVTDRAINRIKEMIEGNTDHLGVLIGVKRRGCNGYSYTMNYAKAEDIESKKYDVIKSRDVVVLVDPKAIFYIAGTVMDFEETELSSEFTFSNPNSKGSCGCGESFNV